MIWEKLTEGLIVWVLGGIGSYSEGRVEVEMWLLKV